MTAAVPAPIPEDGRILFFRRDRAAFGYLSHFHPAPITLDGEVWPTVEHWYQAQKSTDPRYRAAIRACGTPGGAKRLASVPTPPRPDRGSWFLANGEAPRADWEAVKRDLMRRADAAKYAQHRHLAALLLATGEAEIVEDSPHDGHWGVGRDGSGANWAGRILMETRAALRARDAARRRRRAAGLAALVLGAALTGVAVAALSARGASARGGREGRRRRGA